MVPDRSARAAPSPASSPRRPRVELRLRITCSAPDPGAGEAWTEYLLQLVRRRQQKEAQGGGPDGGDPAEGLPGSLQQGG